MNKCMDKYGYNVWTNQEYLITFNDNQKASEYFYNFSDKFNNNQEEEWYFYNSSDKYNDSQKAPWYFYNSIKEQR